VERVLRHVDHLRVHAAGLVIALALSVMVGRAVATIALDCAHNRITFLYQGRFDIPESDKKAHDLPWYTNWSARFLSLEAAAWWMDDVRNLDFAEQAPRFAERVETWAFAWTLLILVTTLYTSRRHGLLACIATGTAILFGYLPGIADRIYPWDLPALFFFALFVWLWRRNRQGWILLLIPVGTLFKETVAVWALAFLWMDGDLRRRQLWAISGAALGLGTYVAAATLIPAGTIGKVAHEGLDAVRSNLQFLGTGESEFTDFFKYPIRRWHLLLINAGWITAFLLWPYKGRMRAASLLMLLVLTLSILQWGVLIEYRIWFECIPLCLLPWTLDDDPCRAP